ncbi:hypothetical protein N1027_17740 [Herbiconiux sp. CPCC 205763]|uniref:Uncharacterized protein n=1 Tax=Herbiconiux aconitum TaxID=2970913 RepID=A0ABT2GUT1_9MICO|nr:hypothetical protein [Herbiconiux aconitum]MCS5719977.1 hypothetical protein [Herbiconiux aconitum]
MTERASESATARRRPLARVAVLAIPGGIVVGAQIGVEYSLVSTVSNLLLDPVWLGGSGSVGLAIFGAMVGAGVGALLGIGVGGFTAGVLALAWAARLPGWAVTVLGSCAVAAAAFGLTALTFGFHLETLLLPLFASTRGVAGVILLSWLAGLRPHDYWDALEARERERASASD